MGPVVGLAYGSYICDWKLVKKSLITEIISLLFCIAAGVVIAAICGPTQLADDWPTDEMKSRATWENFVVGLPVAFFSGLGVAVSLLDDQTSSLVGVAISASLLPPAVNAGVIWVAYAYYNNDLLGTEPVPMTLDYNATEDYMATNDDDLLDGLLGQFLSGGMISLLLTLANIVLIWIASMFMFRLKEVSVLSLDNS